MSHICRAAKRATARNAILASPSSTRHVQAFFVLANTITTGRLEAVTANFQPTTEQSSVPCHVSKITGRGAADQFVQAILVFLR
jgi:hypothetical protein